MVDCAVPAFAWNLYSLMLTDIGMIINMDDRLKIMGVMNSPDLDKYSKTQHAAAHSLACIIRSVLYSEYYARNVSPNMNIILDTIN